MISIEDVEKIARLSKLKLTPPEKEKMSKELSNILSFVEKLGELDLKQVAATSHAVAMQNVFREDKAAPWDNKKEVFEQAPDAENQTFKVPQVIG